MKQYHQYPIFKTLIPLLFCLFLSLFFPLSALAEEENVVILSSENGHTTGQTLVILTIPPEQTLVITTQPQDTTVPEGLKAVFKVFATGVSPISYQWQINRNDGKGWIDVGLNSGVYESSPTKRSNTGFRYRCVITDGSGSSVTTEVAKLTVTAPLPQTGDEEQLGLYGLLAAASLAALLLILKKRVTR